MPGLIKQLDAPPKTKRGLPDYPKFITRTERVRYGRCTTWKAMWVCRCGTKFEAFMDNVLKRHTTSCGCEQQRARKMSFPKHGHFIGDKPSPTYKHIYPLWTSIRNLIRIQTDLSLDSK